MSLRDHSPSIEKEHKSQVASFESYILRSFVRSIVPPRWHAVDSSLFPGHQGHEEIITDSDPVGVEPFMEQGTAVQLDSLPGSRTRQVFQPYQGIYTFFRWRVGEIGLCVMQATPQCRFKNEAFVWWYMLNDYKRATHVLSWFRFISRTFSVVPVSSHRNENRSLLLATLILWNLVVKG